MLNRSAPTPPPSKVAGPPPPGAKAAPPKAIASRNNAPRVPTPKPPRINAASAAKNQQARPAATRTPIPGTRATPRLPNAGVKNPTAAQAAQPTVYPSVLHPGTFSALTPAEQWELYHRSGTHLTPQDQASARQQLKNFTARGQHNTAALQGLGLASMEIPLADAEASFLQSLGHLDLPTRTNVIAGFPTTGKVNTADPSQAGSDAVLYAKAKALGNPVPANATQAELLRAATIPQHHGNWMDAVTNLPRDFALTPLYTYQGGYALGHAANQAAQGNYDPAKEILAQQADAIEHPGAFIQQHPFQAALTLAGGLKSLGGITGHAAAAAGLVDETPRIVSAGPELPPGPNGEIPPRPFLNRGNYDQNLYNRAGQHIQDYTTARLTGNKALKLRARSMIQDAHLRDHQARVDTIGPVKKAAKGISARRQAAILYNEALGATSPELKAFYEHQAAQTGLETAQQQAALRDAQARKFGATLTPKEQAFLDAARTAAQERTSSMLTMTTPSGVGVLNAYSAARRDYHPLATLRASQGDVRAQAWLAWDHQLESLDPRADPQAFHDAQVEAQRTLDDFQHEHLNPTRQILPGGTLGPAPEPGLEPFRVPFTQAKPVSEYRFAGRTVRANKNPKAYIQGLGKHYTGDALTTGNYLTRPDEFYRQLGEPITARTAIDFVNHITDPANGVAITPPDYLRGQPVPHGYVWKTNTNLRATPKTPIDASSQIANEAHAVNVTSDVIRDFEPERTIIPKTGDGVLIPRAVYDELVKTTSRINPSSLTRAGQKATQGVRKSLLFTRPAYPATNLLQGVQQGALGGVGPASWLRAGVLTHGADPIELPLGVRQAGNIATQVRPIGALHPGAAVDEALHHPELSGKALGVAKVAASPITIPIHLLTEGVRETSVAVENAGRTATYIKGASKAARKLAYPNAPVKRFLAKFRIADKAVHDAYNQIARGDTPAAAAARDKAMTLVKDLQGDFGSMGSVPGLDIAVPFHRWLRFSTKLMTQTLPLKHPGPTLAAYRLGALGQTANNQMGLLPFSAQGAIPGGTDPTGLTTLFNTQRLNTLATPGQFLQPDTAGNPTLQGAFGYVNPLYGIAQDAALGRDTQTGRPLTDPLGNPLDATGKFRYALGQIAQLVPPLALAGGSGRGYADTSIPLVSPQKSQKQAQGYQQPAATTVNRILNLISPVRISQLNLTENEKAKIKQLRSTLQGVQNKKNKAELFQFPPKGAPGVTIADREKMLPKALKFDAPIEAARLKFANEWEAIMNELLANPAELNLLQQHGLPGR